jgi:hypothetical protein
MSKEIIKNKVRESLLDRLREVNKTPEGESSEPKMTIILKVKAILVKKTMQLFKLISIKI